MQDDAAVELAIPGGQDAKPQAQDAKPQAEERYTQLIDILELMDNGDTPEDQAKELINLMKRPDIFSIENKGRGRHKGKNKTPESIKNLLGLSNGVIQKEKEKDKPKAKYRRRREKPVIFILPELLKAGRIDLYKIVVARCVVDPFLYSGLPKIAFSHIHRTMTICAVEEAQEEYAKIENWTFDSEEFANLVKQVTGNDLSTSSKKETKASKKAKKEESEEEADEENEEVNENYIVDLVQNTARIRDEEKSEIKPQVKNEMKLPGSQPAQKLNPQPVAQPWPIQQPQALPPQPALRGEQKQQPAQPMEWKINPSSLAAFSILKKQFLNIQPGQPSNPPIDPKLFTDTIAAIKKYYERKFVTDQKTICKLIFEPTAFFEEKPELLTPELKASLDRMKKILSPQILGDLSKNQALAPQKQFPSSLKSKVKDDSDLHVLHGISLLENSKLLDKDGHASLSELAVLIWMTIERGTDLIPPTGKTLAQFQTELKDAVFYQVLCKISLESSESISHEESFDLLIGILSQCHGPISVNSLSKENIPGKIKEFYEEKFKNSSQDVQKAIAESICFANMDPDFAHKPMEKFFTYNSGSWRNEFIKTLSLAIKHKAFSEADVDKSFSDLCSLSSMEQFPSLFKAYEEYLPIFSQTLWDLNFPEQKDTSTPSSEKEGAMEDEKETKQTGQRKSRTIFEEESETQPGVGNSASSSSARSSDLAESLTKNKNKRPFSITDGSSLFAPDKRPRDPTSVVDGQFKKPESVADSTQVENPSQ